MPVGGKAKFKHAAKKIKCNRHKLLAMAKDMSSESKTLQSQESTTTLTVPSQNPPRKISISSVGCSHRV